MLDTARSWTHSIVLVVYRHQEKALPGCPCHDCRRLRGASRFKANLDLVHMRRSQGDSCSLQCHPDRRPSHPNLCRDSASAPAHAIQLNDPGPLMLTQPVRDGLTDTNGRHRDRNRGGDGDTTQDDKRVPRWSRRTQHRRLVLRTATREPVSQGVRPCVSSCRSR